MTALAEFVDTHPLLALLGVFIIFAIVFVAGLIVSRNEPDSQDDQEKLS